MSTMVETAPRTVAARPSRPILWTSYALSAVATLMIGFSGIIKLMNHPEAIKGTVALGYPASQVVGIGILETACLLLYLFPRTAVLGAILLTGYLGGAVATHVRVGDPPFSVLFPVVFGALVWGGLYLRENRLRALIPLRGK